jgi:hypothetical protein
MGFKVRRWNPKTFVCFSSPIPNCCIPSLVCFRLPFLRILTHFLGDPPQMTQLIKQITTSFSPDEQYLVDYFLMRSWSPVEKVRRRTKSSVKSSLQSRRFLKSSLFSQIPKHSVPRLHSQSPSDHRKLFLAPNFVSLWNHNKLRQYVNVTWV